MSMTTEAPVPALTSDGIEAKLVDLAAACSRDPLRFVMVAFAWPDAGAEDEPHGPDVWQRDILEQIGAGLRTGSLTPAQAVQIAIASGHGPGKSALVAWVILWAITTHPDTRGIVTANTESQLRQKTWAELAKWFRLCLWRHWFDMTATAIYSSDAAHEKTWRVDAVAWSERNVEAFAGLHNQGRRVLAVFDEASAIPDVIWETTEGALTDADTEIIWLVCGNPTRNTGRFRECFGRFRHRWLTRQIDSRTARLTNKEQIASWVSDYGEDSDFVRVRVRGEFPRAGSMQFISSEVVEEASRRELMAGLSDALVIGVDIARHGEDQSVIFFRRGRDARSIPPIKLRIPDTMQVAARVAEEARQLNADGVFVDATGMGWGVFDRLKQLGVPNVFAIEFSRSPDRVNFDDPIKTANKRAEIWASMREWLKGGAIPDDPELKADLTGVEYGYNARDEILLERKEDMRRRGLASPDLGDGLALTFSYPIAPRMRAMRGEAASIECEYNPYASAYADVQSGGPWRVSWKGIGGWGPS